MSHRMKQRFIELAMLIITLNYLIGFLENLSITAVGFIVALVYLVVYRLARRGQDESQSSYKLYMYVPAALLVVVPFVFDVMVSGKQGVGGLLTSLPWLQLILPVGLLYLSRSDRPPKAG